MTALIVTASLSLSAEQVAQRDLGHFDAEISVASLKLEDRAKLRGLAESMPGGGSTAMILTTTVIAPPEFGADRFVFREGNWASKPFDGLTLSEGRWPKAAGEVAVDPRTAERFGVGSRISMASDAVIFEVVGVAEDKFDDHVILYAAAGTWQALQPGPAGSLRLDEVYLSVLTTKLAQAEVLDTFARLNLSAETTARDEVESDLSWVKESPFTFIVPALLLPLLSAALTAGLARRRARRFVQRAQSVGMPGTLGGAIVRVAFVAWAFSGTIVGVAIGVVAGVLLRPLVAVLAGQPAGPMPELVRPVTILLGGVLTGGLLGLAGLSISQRLQPPSPSSAPGSSFFLRRWLALLAVCGTVFAFYRVNDVSTAMVFGAVALLVWLLLTPDIVTATARRLPRTGPATRLASRLLAGRGFASTAGVAVMTVLIVLPTTTALMLTATGSTARDNALADVAHGQISIDLGVSDEHSASDLGQIALAALGNDYDQIIEVSVLDAWYEVTSGNTLTLSVSSATDASALLGRPLTTDQSAKLQAGGMLVWQPGFQLFADDRPANPQPPIVRYEPAPEWRKQAGALMLDSTANAHGIASTPDKIVTTGSSHQAGDRIREALAHNGVDTTMVSAWHQPRTIAPPLAITLSLATLIVILIATAFAASRAHIASLRRDMQRLIAIGTPRTFPARVLIIIQVVTVTISVVVGTAISAATALVLLARNTGVDLNPPYAIIASYLLAVFIATGMSIALSVRALRPAPARDG